jgi:lysophospholipase L1-like esterase
MDRLFAWRRMPLSIRVFWMAVGGILLGGALPVCAEPAATNCPTPRALTALAEALPHSAARIASGAGLTIVAIGSSSTKGAGATSPAATYPARLEAELQKGLPKLEIRVVNRGVSGEDVPEELVRLDRDAIEPHPDLVIWQVGTNAVLRRDDLAADEQLIRRGVALLKQRGIDIVLMDLQYAPRVLQRRGHATMEKILADIARQEHVALFHRFEVMRYWAEEKRPETGPLIGDDGLHMTDASYGCLAGHLADALLRDWRTFGLIAGRPAPGAAVAGLAGPP